MTHWVMVLDSRNCIGCKTCIYACSHANTVPDGYWRRIVEFEEPKYPERHRNFLTRSCMHCADPPCLKVCPTKATYRRDDGIVAIDHDKCVGCSACILACPYDSRVIYTAQYDFETGGSRNNNREGTCSKCNFCLSRIKNGIDQGMKPGIDVDATPVCVITCCTGALHFGDLDDPESNVSKLIKQNKCKTLGEEFKTKPSIYYIID